MLTTRQQHILHLLRHGQPNDRIALKVGIHPRQVAREIEFLKSIFRVATIAQLKNTKK